MSTISTTLNINSALLDTYFFYSGILVLKVLTCAAMVGFSRVRYMVPITEEDAKYFKSKVRDHEIVDRNRRVHLNDLENIPLFLIISFVYLMTNPSVLATLWLFRIYTISRIIHTIIYTTLKTTIPRIFVFQIGVWTIVYMCISSIIHFM